MGPQFPVYLPSKSRAKVALTPHVLARLGVPFRLVVEQQQAGDYAAVFGADRILILDPEYQRSYDTCIPAP